MHENCVLFLPVNILMVWCADFLGCTVYLIVIPQLRGILLIYTKPEYSAKSQAAVV